MTLMQGVRLYPKAIAWSMLIRYAYPPHTLYRYSELIGSSSCCALEGYAVALVGNLFAFPPFQRKFGNLQPNGSYEIPASWQSGLSTGAQCGQVVGLISMSCSYS